MISVKVVDKKKLSEQMCKGRKAPPYKSKAFPKETKKGIDGKMYISVKTKTGYTWVAKVKPEKVIVKKTTAKPKTVAAKAMVCKSKGKVLDKKTKRCRESKAKK